jgi:ABC-2 type transport system ATP-binding protein
MKQRVGIAMALLGSPALLILDEPINGLDTDGMRIMREILVDITKNYNCTVLISSHILGELEKIATHYGIIRGGKLVQEITAEEMEARARVFVTFKVEEPEKALSLLKKKYSNVKKEENFVRVYDEEDVDGIVKYLIDNKIIPSEIKKNKVGLEEYYIELMSAKEGK